MSLEVKASKAASKAAESHKSTSPTPQAKLSVGGDKEGGKSFSSLVNLFSSVIGVNRGRTTFVPDFTSRTRDREEDVTPRPREDKEFHDSSRRDLGVRSRDDRGEEGVRSRDEGYGDGRRGGGDEEGSGRDRSEDTGVREASRNDSRPLKEGGNGRDEGVLRGRETTQDTGGEKSEVSSQGDTQNQAENGNASGEKRSEGESVAKASSQNEDAEDATAVDVDAGGETNVASLSQDLPNTVVDALRVLLLSRDALAELANGNLQDKNLEDIPASQVVSVLDNLLTVGEKTALVRFLVQNSGSFDTSGSEQSQQQVSSGSSQNDGLRALVLAAQNPENQALRGAVNKLLAFNVDGWKGQSQQGRQDVNLLGSDEGLDVDVNLLEKLKVALSRVIQGGQSRGSGTDAQKLAGEGEGVSVEVKKAGTEGVLRVNPLDTKSLSQVQEGQVLKGDNKDLDVPEDLRLRAQKVFVETDSGKTEKTISRVNDNLLSQSAVSTQAAQQAREGGRSTLDRFAQAGATKSANTKAGSDQLVKVNVQQRSDKQDILWESRTDRSGRGEGASQTRGKDGEGNLLGNQSGVRSEKVANSQKDARTQRDNLASNVREQIRVNVSRAVNSGQDRIRLRLNPQELGRLDVRITIGKDGSLVARIFVERQETLDLLRNDARSLLEALKESGLKAGGDSLEFSLQNSERDFSGESKKKKATEGLVAGVEGVEAGEDVSGDVALSESLEGGLSSDEDGSEEESEKPRLDVVV